MYPVGLINFFIDYFCLLDNRNHLAGGEAHLIRPHHELERLFVNTHRRLVVLNHFEGVASSNYPIDELSNLVFSIIRLTQIVTYFWFHVWQLFYSFLSMSLSRTMLLLSLSLATWRRMDWRWSGWTTPRRSSEFSLSLISERPKKKMIRLKIWEKQKLLNWERYTFIYSSPLTSMLSN